MSAPAPPAARPSATSRRAAARRGFLGGLGAFGIVAAICIAIGMIEYAGSGGRYHAWTWVKVGFLYLLSSCDVAVRVRAIGAGTNLQLLYRVPLLAGTTLILWLIVRATRRALGEDPAKGVSVAGGAAAALGFAVPGVLVALPANLRFPSSLPFELFVSPVRWQAAVLVPAVSAAGAATGVFLARRHRPTARSEAGALAAAWLGGGARMFASALLLGLVGFLVTAALRPTQTRAYVQDAQGWGRGGVVAVTHHILLIPDQSIWLLAPSMGGVTHLRVDLGDQPLGRLSITLREITLGGEALGADAGPFPRHVPLDAAARLFLLVPAISTVLGGRAAARERTSSRERVVVGLGAGVVFAIFVTLGVWMTRAALPFPPVWLTRLTISAAMPSTALLALVWGVAGGALGASTAGWWPAEEPAEVAAEKDQEPVASDPA